MELFIILVSILFWWGVIRFFGMVFNGPRHRRRVRRREYQRAMEYWRYGPWW